MARTTKGIRPSGTAEPLTAVEFEILVALADADLHGYGIILEVEGRTNGSVRLRPGSLYRALARMEDDGWVEEAADRVPSENDDARRRYYRLTEAGRKAARREARRLARAVESAREKNLIGEVS